MRTESKMNENEWNYQTIEKPTVAPDIGIMKYKL